MHRLLRVLFLLLGLQYCVHSEVSQPFNGIRSVPIANNISFVLTQWSPPAVRVSWIISDHSSTSEPITKVTIAYYPKYSSKYLSSKDVSPSIHSVELCDLEPKTEYEVQLSVVTTNNTYRSPKIGFISPSSENDFPQTLPAFGGRRAYRGGVAVGYVNNKGPVVYRLDEIAIVVFVLCFWLAVIFLFCNKWGKIRHLEPYQPQYQPETPYQSPVYSIHGNKPQRMNTCNSNSYPPFFMNSRVNIQSFERQRTFSQGSKLGSLYHCASACIYPTQFENRQRVNSVFVGMSSPSHKMDFDSPLKRKYKSAEDIKMYSIKHKLFDHQKRASHTNLSHFHPYFRQ